MEKIPFVLNLNLAIDKTVRIPRWVKGSIHRFPRALTKPGGKGANVAKALKSLGSKSLIMGFAGGWNGRWISETLDREGFEFDVTHHDGGESRICYSVVEPDGISTDFNEDGPRVPPCARKIFLGRLKKNLPKASFVSVSGRTPPDIPRGFYAEIISLAKKRRIAVALDMRGKCLAEGIRAGADFVKINKIEFEEVSKTPLNARNAEKFYEKSAPRGLKALIVTNEGKPGLCAAGNETWTLKPAGIGSRLVNSVGAGDSFMAGFIHAYLKGMKMPEMLEFALACSASDCLTLAAGEISKKQVYEFLGECEARPVARRNG